MYKLRPHHGMCIQFFVGKGYNEAFVNNMAEFIQTLEGNPLVKLVVECDEVCSACPEKLATNKCRSDIKVASIDNRVLSYLDLEPGEVINWLDFKRRIQLNILDKNYLEAICYECEWLDLCKS